MRQLDKLDRLLGYIEGVMISSLAILALILGVSQVVLRYVFNTGFHWNEPIFMTLTIWSILFASSRAVRENVHARVEFFAESLPGALPKIMGFLSYVASLLQVDTQGTGKLKFINTTQTRRTI